MDQALERIHVPAWAWLLLAVAVFGIYLMTQENGAVLRGAVAGGNLPTAKRAP